MILMSKNYLVLYCFLSLTTVFYSQTKRISNKTQLVNELDAIAAGTSTTTTIVLEENTYVIDSEIELTSAHNGITISGCGAVYLNGGVVLNPNNFEDYSSVSSGFNLVNPAMASNIKVYDLTSLGISKSDLGTHNHHGYGFSDDFETPSMLWLDEGKMDLARWPNKNEVVSANDLIISSKWEDLRLEVSGAISYKDILETGTKDSATDGIKFTINSERSAKIAAWDFYKTSEEKIWMDGVVHSSWEWEYNQIKEIANAEIKMQYGSNSSFSITTENGRAIDPATKVSHFHFENIPEELDTEGEYFIDRDNMLLYFYPPVGWESKKLSLSTLNANMLSISNAANIRIENITLEAGLKNGIVIDNSENITIDNSIIRNFNQWGIRVEGTDNLVNNCELYNLGAGGVKLGLENKTFHLTKENNSVQNSKMHNFAWDQKSQVPGITLSGCGNKALQNEIYDAPHFAVKFRQARGCVVEGNNIHDLPNYHHFDGGAIYLGLGINFQNRENVVKNNTLSKVPTNGIYLDNYTVGNFVEGNVLYDVGNSADGANYAAIYNHGGGQNYYTDNIAIDCAVFVKTGSHIVKSSTGATWKYLKGWFQSVQTGQGFNPDTGAHYNAFVTEYSASELAAFIGYLSDLPLVVETELPLITSNAEWNLVRGEWDRKGYDAMKDENDVTGLSEWQQWRNYFQLIFQRSDIENNLSMHTDTSKLPSGGTGTWGGVTLGDGEVFWEYSPYFELDDNGNKVDYLSLHVPEDNEALTISETTNTFPNVVVNDAINQNLYPSIAYSGGNLANEISLNLQSRGDLDTVVFDACPVVVCDGIQLASFSYMEEAACDGSTKIENYTVVQKDIESEAYAIDLSGGTDSQLFTLFFLEDWDSTGKPSGPFDADVSSMPDSDFIQFNGSHTGFEISRIDKMSADCWNWNRRVNVELVYTGNDFESVHELELRFNPNNNLISKNGELYCSQIVKMSVKVNNPELSVEEETTLSSRFYPNPVTAVLQVSNKDIIKRIKLFDTVGRLVKEEQFHAEQVSIEMEGLPSGIYLIQLETIYGRELFQIIKQ